MQGFSERLRYFRSLRNLSQAELAKLVGLSTKQISDYEVGVTANPRQSTFIKILNALGVTEIEFNSSNCILGKQEQETQLNPSMPMAMILASSLRGRLLTISGRTQRCSTSPTVTTIHIYSGTITRTIDHGEDFVHVYYLSGTDENCIYVNRDGIGPILDCMREENVQGTQRKETI